MFAENIENVKLVTRAAAKLGRWGKTMPNDVDFLMNEGPAIVSDKFKSNLTTPELLKNCIDALDKFFNEIDPKKPFMAGEKLNLVDIELYGAIMNNEFNPLFTQVLIGFKIAT